MQPFVQAFSVLQDVYAVKSICANPRAALGSHGSFNSFQLDPNLKCSHAFAPLPHANQFGALDS